MAGQLSLTRARRQGAAQECDECDEQPLGRPIVRRAGEFAKGPGWVTHPKATRRLMNYWARGKGAAKIRWGVKGSMRRCIRRLRKYFPENAGGLCSNLHRKATGEWPRGGVIPS